MRAEDPCGVRLFGMVMRALDIVIAVGEIVETVRTGVYVVNVPLIALCLYVNGEEECRKVRR